MSNYAISLKRSTALLAALSFTALLLVVNFASFFSTAQAAQVTNRSLTLSSTLAGDVADGDPGSETNGAEADHTFAFTTATTTPVQSILLRYCQEAIGPCTAVADMDATNVTLGGVAVLNNDWEIGAASANTVRLVNTDAAQNIAGNVSFTIVGVKNPETLGTFFVRISTHSDDDPDTADWDDLVDDGTVASSITEGIYITTRVAETLGFSTTGDFGEVDDPGASCSPLEGSGAITLGDPDEQTLSLLQAYDNYSAFRLYTNAASGVVVQYEGDTLRKGNDPLNDPDINPIGTGVESSPGTEQFGLAIDTVSGGEGVAAPVMVASSDSPLQFQYVDTATNLGANGALTPAAGYANGSGALTAGGAQFSFAANTPTTIASTAGYTECKTVAVRYVANISPTTTSGTYSTTIVYSAVPTY